MSNTYTTTIDELRCLQSPQPNYVVTVYFSVFGTDGVNTATCGGNIQLEETSETNGFVPYESLTEATVLEWINNATNNQEVFHANIDAQLSLLAQPPVVPSKTQLPWITPNAISE
jgi:hypothetical protein